MLITALVVLCILCIVFRNESCYPSVRKAKNIVLTITVMFYIALFTLCFFAPTY